MLLTFPSPSSSNLALTPMPTDTDEGVFLSVQGVEGSGKTRFSFSAPAPILYLNLDGGNWKRVRKHFPTKDISMEEFDIPAIPENFSTQNVQDIMLPIWMRFRRMALQGIADGAIRTIVTDKGNTAWALARLGHLGKINGVKSQHYDEVNADFRSLLIAMSNSKKINILINAEEEEYIDNARTGRMKRAGFKEVGERTKDSLRCFREDGKFYTQILLSKTNPAQDAKVFKDNNNTFVDVAMALYPGSLPTDWM